ncbi:MAG TPA: hypothetical protein VNF73_15950, partial [Candidatus Saccharimonadales bacterium]|nr:hypothetical protein [Candidatus Saccharimonadales bacterium]
MIRTYHGALFWFRTFGDLAAWTAMARTSRLEDRWAKARRAGRGGPARRERRTGAPGEEDRRAG